MRLSLRVCLCVCIFSVNICSTDDDDVKGHHHNQRTKPQTPTTMTTMKTAVTWCRVCVCVLLLLTKTFPQIRQIRSLDTKGRGRREGGEMYVCKFCAHCGATNAMTQALHTLRLQAQCDTQIRGRLGGRWVLVIVVSDTQTWYRSAV